MDNRKLKVFHGSPLPVPVPDLAYCSRYSDFGKGFYVTTNRKQAIEWGAKRTRGNTFAVTTFELDLINTQELKIKEFTNPDKEWLELLIRGRNGEKLPYDIIIGPVADAKVRPILEIYTQAREQVPNPNDPATQKYIADLTETTLQQLNVKGAYSQFALLNDKALTRLKYLSNSIYDTKTQTVIMPRRKKNDTFTR